MIELAFVKCNNCGNELDYIDGNYICKNVDLVFKNENTRGEIMLKPKEKIPPKFLPDEYYYINGVRKRKFR